MKETKRILSAQVDLDAVELLKEICRQDRRSQAKTLEILIENEAKKRNIELKLSA